MSNVDYKNLTDADLDVNGQVFDKNYGGLFRIIRTSDQWDIGGFYARNADSAKDMVNGSFSNCIAIFHHYC